MSAQLLEAQQSITCEVIKSQNNQEPKEPKEVPLLVNIPSPVSKLVDRRTVAILNPDGTVVVEIEVPLDQKQIMVTRPEKGQTIHFYDYANIHLLSNRGYPI